MDYPQSRMTFGGNRNFQAMIWILIKISCFNIRPPIPSLQVHLKGLQLSRKCNILVCSGSIAQEVIGNFLLKPTYEQSRKLDMKQMGCVDFSKKAWSISASSAVLSQYVKMIVAAILSAHIGFIGFRPVVCWNLKLKYFKNIEYKAHRLPVLLIPTHNRNNR